MEHRVDYLINLANYTGFPEDSILKKEARIFFEESLESLDIISVGEICAKFGSKIDLLTKQPLYGPLSVTYEWQFEFVIRYSHVYFNINLPKDRCLFNILYDVFKLDEKSADLILRQCIKKLLMKNNVPINKKIKFFVGKII